jgi:hypothetical protein
MAASHSITETDTEPSNRVQKVTEWRLCHVVCLLVSYYNGLPRVVPHRTTSIGRSGEQIILSAPASALSSACLLSLSPDRPYGMASPVRQILGSDLATIQNPRRLTSASPKPPCLSLER